MYEAGEKASKVLSVGIDWITATCKPGPRQYVLGAQAKRWVEKRVLEGFQEKPFEWSDYSGSATDGVSYGDRPDGFMIRLSGEMARQNADVVLRYASHVSRLDVQMTLEHPYPWFDWAKQVISVVSNDARVMAGMTKTMLLRGSPNGRTAYIGSRVSDRFYRVYDKTAESKGAYPPNCWRWEVEYKQGRAERLAAHLKEANPWPHEIASIITNAYLDYGQEVPTSQLARNWVDTSPREETDDQRRLEWLRKTIAPTLERMYESVGKRGVLSALGIIDIDERTIVDLATGEVIVK